MLVHERALVLGEFQNVAGIPHGQGKRASFGGVQPPKINGHEHRGHLVIGNSSGGEFADKIPNLFGHERLPVALGFD